MSYLLTTGLPWMAAGIALSTIIRMLVDAERAGAFDTSGEEPLPVCRASRSQLRRWRRERLDISAIPNRRRES